MSDAPAPEQAPLSSTQQAADIMRQMREAPAAAEAPETPAEKPQQPRHRGRFASTATESPPQEVDAGPEAVPGEPEADDQEAELPSIDPPRSWSKEDKELFQSLPRETQERVADRERSRESDFLKRQNEAAERNKALEAKERAAETARQQYEHAVANTLEALQSRSEFADIKSTEDIRRMAEDDPFRYVKWQAHQDSVNRLTAEQGRLQEERAQRTQQQFSDWAKEQDDKFASQIKDFADPKKAADLREKVILPYLQDRIGIAPEALARLWHEPIFRAAEMQQIIYDAARFNAAKERASAAVAVQKPAPQRPGVAQGKTSPVEAKLADLNKRIPNAKGQEAIRTYADIFRLQRQVQSK